MSASIASASARVVGTSGGAGGGATFGASASTTDGAASTVAAPSLSESEDAVLSSEPPSSASESVPEGIARIRRASARSSSSALRFEPDTAGRGARGRARAGRWGVNSLEKAVRAATTRKGSTMATATPARHAASCPTSSVRCMSSALTPPAATDAYTPAGPTRSAKYSHTIVAPKPTTAPMPTPASAPTAGAPPPRPAAAAPAAVAATAAATCSAPSTDGGFTARAMRRVMLVAT